MNKLDYGAIVGAYNGVENIPRILNHLSMQTRKPREVIVWINKHPTKTIDTDWLQRKYPGIQIIDTNQNYGVYGRFTASSLLKSKYAMVFDDDTVPGQLWAENCMITLDKVGENSIIGATGVTMKSDAYTHHEKFGNDRDTMEITECDLVGHCWLYRKDLVKYMFDEDPVSVMNGEDVHFSASAQINEGIKTYVPAQPNALPELHGSMYPKLGLAAGRLSTIDLGGHFNIRNKIVSHWINKGWQLKYKR
jgi:GT2 family glycosyltransferase